MSDIDNAKRFFHFIKERHAIWVLRSKGAHWPWTSDPILRTYKFTNVFRELDTGTVWLRENILEPYADSYLLFFNVALYRHYNYWPMASALLQEWGRLLDWDNKVEIIKFIRKYKKAGNQVFTGAHMINCAAGVDKIEYVFDVCTTDLWANRHEYEPHPGDTLRQAYSRLLACTGYGPFITYEVITDLRHTRYLENATDIMTWANPGPGCQRGILRLMDIPIKNQAGLPKLPEGVNMQYFIAYMRWLLSLSTTFLPDWVPALEMRDIEHSLCEFDKYERVRLGEGRPRSLYHPPTGVK